MKKNIDIIKQCHIESKDDLNPVQTSECYEQRFTEDERNNKNENQILFDMNVIVNVQYHAQEYSRFTCAKNTPEHYRMILNPKKLNKLPYYHFKI